ncbi:MAG: energy transducer TonB [Ginsengibacter sp.]
MEAQQILQSNLLDILFEGKNKSYGAYELRGSYNKRISGALLIVVSIIAATVFVYFFGGTTKIEMPKDWTLDEKTLLKVPKEIDAPKPQLPEPKPAMQRPVATVKLSTLEIVDEKKVLQPPPDQNEIARAQIDVKANVGDEFTGILAPPDLPVGTQILAGVSPGQENKDSVFMTVEIDATFPGGPAAWHKFVSNAIMKEMDEFAENDFGTCNVQFIVDKDGNVSDVHALDMKGSKLAEIAVNSIRKGPRWNAAMQNGKKVNAYRRQPVTFRNPDR